MYLSDDSSGLTYAPWFVRSPPPLWILGQVQHDGEG